MRQDADRSQNVSIADAAAFTRFVEEVGPRALRLSYRWTGDRQAAEDAVQEALLRTWRSRTRISESPSAWFFTILWNVVLTQRKRARSDLGSGPQQGDSAPETGDSYQDVDDRLDIGRLLATLPEIDRRLLAMRYGEDFTIQDIARITGMPVGTVKSRIHRALSHLRKSMSAAGQAMPRGSRVPASMSDGVEVNS